MLFLYGQCTVNPCQTVGNVSMILAACTVPCVSVPHCLTASTKQVKGFVQPLYFLTFVQTDSE